MTNATAMLTALGDPQDERARSMIETIEAIRREIDVGVRPERAFDLFTPAASARAAA